MAGILGYIGSSTGGGQGGGQNNDINDGQNYGQNYEISSDRSNDPNLNEPGSQELFESSASLCVPLACSKEGSLLLLEHSFFARICALQFFRTPPPSIEVFLFDRFLF